VLGAQRVEAGRGGGIRGQAGLHGELHTVIVLYALLSSIYGGEGFQVLA
jgi:molybdenum-dependent DNA-binding transcriptional regulator ModE